MIDVFKSAYNFVDMTTLVKTLVHSAGYTTVAAENSMSVISTWGNKLNMIIVSISTGIIISLIPNLTSSSVKGDKRMSIIRLIKLYKYYYSYQYL